MVPPHHSDSLILTCGHIWHVVATGCRPPYTVKHCPPRVPDTPLSAPRPHAHQPRRPTACKTLTQRGRGRYSSSGFTHYPHHLILNSVRTANKSIEQILSAFYPGRIYGCTMTVYRFTPKCPQIQPPPEPRAAVRARGRGREIRLSPFVQIQLSCSKTHTHRFSSAWGSPWYPWDAQAMHQT